MERMGAKQTREKNGESTGNGAGEKNSEVRRTKNEVKPEVSSSEKPPSADDTPSQHGIADELVETFLRRFLPVDSQFVVKSYRYRPVANFGEGYTTVRKVLEVDYQDQTSGEEQMAAFVVKIPGKSCRPKGLPVTGQGCQ